MSKYRKGRVLVLAGMLGFSSLTVLAGSAAAESGKLQVYGVTTTTQKKSKNHLPTACVTLAANRFDGKHKHSSTEPTFKVKGGYNDPKAERQFIGDEVTDTRVDGSLNGTMQYDLSYWLTGLDPKKGTVKQMSKKGVHIEVVYNGKHRSFWVKDWTRGCDQGAPPEGDTCPANAETALTAPSTATLANVQPGQQLKVTFTGYPELDEASVVATLDENIGTETDLDVNVTAKKDGTGTIFVTMPSDIVAGSMHSVTISVAEGDNGEPCSTLVFWINPAPVG